MRILIGESGTVTSEYNRDEFELLGSYALFGNLFYSARRDNYDQPGADYIGPMVSTAEGANYLAHVARLKVSRSIENNTLVRDTLKGARPATDSPNTMLVDWQSDDQVSAVRARLLRGLFEDGELPGGSEQSPGQSLYDALRVVGEVVRLPLAEAAVQAALFNDAVS